MTNTAEVYDTGLEPGGVTWVDDEAGLRKFLPYLLVLRKGTPEIAADCEANQGLSRNGNVSHLNISVKSLNHSWVFDILKLGAQAFDMRGEESQNMRQVLESNEIIQLWFDVRGDSDALFAHFGIKLGYVRDIQLMEIAVREKSFRKSIKALVICLKEQARKAAKEKSVMKSSFDRWLRGKIEGHAFFRENGLGVLGDDPLNETVREYIAGDAECLFALHDSYESRLEKFENDMSMSPGSLLKLIDDESSGRLEESWAENFNRNIVWKKAPAAFQALPVVWGEII